MPAWAPSYLAPTYTYICNDVLIPFGHLFGTVFALLQVNWWESNPAYRASIAALRNAKELQWIRLQLLRTLLPLPAT